MMNFITTINDWLGKIGGTVGLISLIITIVISNRTGSIRKTIIRNREFTEYKEEKKIALKNLEELMASIKDDQIYYDRMKFELLKEINKLLKYKGFVDFTSKVYIKEINWLLKNSKINSQNKDRLVTLISKLCGRMCVNPVDQRME